MNQQRFLKNSIFNILSGIFTALVSVGLPPILARTLDIPTFTAWILLLQIGAYLNYLNLGGQVVFSKYIAEATNAQDVILDKKQTVTSGLVFLIILASAGFLLLIAAIQFVPFLNQLMHKSSLISIGCLILIFFSFAVIFPLSGINGYFIGLQKNQYVFISNLILRSLVFLLVNIAAFSFGSLISLSWAYAISHLGIVFYILYLFKVKKEGLIFNFQFFSRKRFFEIVHFCSGYSAWSFSMFLVSGLTLTLVAQYDYQNLGIYSICLSIITAFTGLHSAIFNNLLPEFAALEQSFNKVQRGGLLVLQTRSSTTILSAIMLFLLLGASFLLPVWAGKVFKLGDDRLFEFLIVACFIRWTGTPYALHLLATNQQRLGIISAVIEGVITVGMAALFGTYFGAYGVVWASFFGGITGVLCNISLNFKNDQFAKIDVPSYLYQGLIQPLISILPIIVVLFIECYFNKSFFVLRWISMFLGFSILYFCGNGKALVGNAKHLLMAKMEIKRNEHGNFKKFD